MNLLLYYNWSVKSELLEPKQLCFFLCKTVCVILITRILNSNCINSCSCSLVAILDTASNSDQMPPWLQFPCSLNNIKNCYAVAQIVVINLYLFKTLIIASNQTKFWSWNQFWLKITKNLDFYYRLSLRRDIISFNIMLCESEHSINLAYLFQ